MGRRRRSIAKKGMGGRGFAWLAPSDEFLTRKRKLHDYVVETHILEQKSPEH